MKKFFLILLLINAFLFKEQKNVFDSTQIKNMKLKNRIFRGSVGDCTFKDGKISEEGFKLYEEFAKNEVGTIFTGYATVSDYNQLDNLQVFRIDKNEYIEEYKKLTSLVHKYGANIMAQIVHIGMNTAASDEIIYSPSKMLNKNTNKETHEMTKEDILRIEDDFVKAAVRAKKAGFDGIELHAAHFYLLSEFLSPLYNHRTDEYGGSDENRARIIVEILEKMRPAVGNDFIISMKINTEEGEGGITENGVITACKLAEKAGLDLIQLSGISWQKEKSKTPFYYDIGKKLADILKIPVMVTAGARDLDNLNEILNNSNIQYFGIARPLICESNLIKRWKDGETKKAKCVSCNTCLRNFVNGSVACILNKKKKL
jgi:2,4-dienoyl-CoA reductase-like NADH-dependent reductase (Old Yellow Enzyme family)